MVYYLLHDNETDSFNLVSCVIRQSNRSIKKPGYKYMLGRVLRYNDTLYNVLI